MNAPTPTQTPLSTTTSVPAAAVTFNAIWNYPVGPSSLMASIITSYDLVDQQTTAVVHYAVDCPPADKPDNNMCRSLGMYPMEVYYTQGSVRAGLMTDQFRDRTTAWTCHLGTCPSSATACHGPVSASCNLTITGSAGPATTRYAFPEPCGQNSVPIEITAGLDKVSMPAYWLPTGTWTDVAEYAAAMTSAWNSELVESGCSTRLALDVLVSSAAQDGESSTAGPPATTTTDGGSASTTPPAPVPPVQTAGAARTGAGSHGLKVIGVVGAICGLTQMVLSL
ncbi:uncharacterized protein B0I36DRAFT_336007 [Microdochium trichocladiopsis]|uniref:Uncharacterized protein n=1 Tax=Microdochium trichocladiopsis TaxID=1682393 RepID=A0A9P9BN47_9PEZI|nr:uncharacterized protein B0I36DRAFT_336007 [Microdochium trichocladiopsis]KAH7018467.1 hypothetical protein B0I36DRAFT_336007 [Microdochium trichocladiopsis]